MVAGDARRHGPRRSLAVLAVLAAPVLCVPTAIVSSAGHRAHDGQGRVAATWRAAKEYPPATGDLFDPDCTTAAVCFALGDFGRSEMDQSSTSFTSSTNGGASWSVVPTPASFAASSPNNGGTVFHPLSCSGQTCLIAGYADQGAKAAVLVTTNGGRAWTTKAPVAGLNITGFDDLACPSSTTCFALATVGSSSVIARTTNDGGTWTIQSHPAAAMSSIACSSASACGAVATTTGAEGFFDTVDGGTVWTARTTLASAAGEVDVACASATTCVIAGGSGASVTTNGGQTWAPQSLPISMQVNSVACLSASACELVGARSSNGDPTVLGTTNRGGSWTSQAVPLATDGFLRAPSDETSLVGISCAGKSTCLLVGDAAPVNISYYEFGFAFLTTTSGHRWTSQSLPIGADSVDGVDCRTMSCEAVSISPRGLFVGSTNGGASWSAQAESVPSQGGVYADVACASALVCEAVGDAVTSPVTGTGESTRTTDGGKVWHRTPLPIASSLFGIACPSVTICVAVGLNSTETGPLLLRTTDGGAKWAPLHPPAGTGQVVDVACASTTRCEAVGDASGGALVIGTTNGVTWKRQTLEKSAAVKSIRELYAVSCPIATICLAGGVTSSSGGALLVTTDGGAAWRAEKVPAGAGQVNDVSCATGTACELVADLPAKPGALAYGTTNRGATWVHQALPAGILQLFAVSCPATTGCVATGDTLSSVGLIVRLIA